MSETPNRLAQETSPYLLQHAHNPVDWYPWGDEAFERAKLEDKPVLLSVGYSACHWCHVMAHESFEDPGIAHVMNRDFVSVKVDREERPDVDAIYMNAVQTMTGQGGWPMTMFLTPDGQPFYGGTYYPPDDRYGRPGFRRILASLADVWQNRRHDALTSAQQLTEHLGRLAQLPAGEREPSREVVTRALTTLAGSFDHNHGGFGAAPKFPPHSVLRLLLRQADADALGMAELTLTKMAKGGIYDHLGGGFARYSVDERWLVPHFEKMLYDNAQLVQRYLEAYQRTGDALYRTVVEETLGWARREMLDQSGGFYSALDADSEGEEGKYYVWHEDEVNALLEGDAPLARAYYDVTPAGNFEGHTILNVRHAPEAVAAQFGLGLDALSTKLETIRTTLFEAREKRIRPGLDDKILCSWNGLMLTTFADAGRILERRDYLETALQNARFIRDAMLEDGRLRHSYKNGVAKVSGLLEDYAYYGLGLVALYQANLEPEWLTLAQHMADTITTHFKDPNGGFYSTPDDGETLIVRPKDLFDSATPADSAAAAELLLTLSRYNGLREWEEMAADTLNPLLEALEKQPTGFGTLLCVLEQLIGPSREIAVFGDPQESQTQALLEVIREHPLTNSVIALARDANDPVATEVVFMQGRDRVEGKANVYVCENRACRLPVTTPEELAVQLQTLAMR